ncbi:MAG: transcription elongation factor GreA [Erysipelotrichaceae bacterium]|nr:transcription elongation factor GreA [Erysipelotrichaceae bacterium]MDD3923750.1 transcription elongation factor GreA [Erysipelotrichaceae bacterium]MDD4642328.1 transcription elongation factor GreA [Erysipelotrichaceae bacterium]
MAKEKILVTQEGLNELIKERDHLIHVIRPEVKEDLVAARAQGDLSENADYDAARERQGKIEARIIELDHMLSNYELIEENNGSKHLVKLGSTVTVLDMHDNTEETYTIVGSVEADPLNGKLSNVTPLAVAILEKKEGDVVSIEVKEPYKVKILKIS